MADRFEPFGTEHQLLIVLFLLGCPVFALLGRILRERAREQVFRRGFGLLILVFTVPLQLTLFLPGEYHPATSIPLQLCDLAWPLAAFALLTRNARATQLLYYWGLVLSSQAVFTPDLVEAFPHPRYLMFWGMHFLTVWAACYLTFGLGIRPTWRGLRFAVLVTGVWAVLVMGINSVADTNYGYLNRKPPGASILDLFGPWPVYVVVEVVLITLVWALITWPWTRGSRPEPQQRLAGPGADLDGGDR